MWCLLRESHQSCFSRPTLGGELGVPGTLALSPARPGLSSWSPLEMRRKPESPQPSGVPEEAGGFGRAAWVGSVDTGAHSDVTCGHDRKSGHWRVDGEARSVVWAPTWFSLSGKWCDVASHARVIRLVTTHSSPPWSWPRPAVGSGRLGGQQKRVPFASGLALPMAHSFVPSPLPILCF